MMEQKKEIMVSGKEMEFYRKCYERFGYEVEEIQENKHQLYHTMILHKKEQREVAEEDEQLRCMEEKLRIVEIIDQKKSRFFVFFLNLLLHVAIFCIQAVIFERLELSTAHPAVMLRVGVVILQVVLVFGLGIKLWEWFRWNHVQKAIKDEILAMEMETPSGKFRAEEKTETPYYVSVLFTRGVGLVSMLIYWGTGRQYTHASIGLGEQTECFYSFNFRGFRTEHPSHRKLKNGKKNSLCYQFRVTKEEYQQLEETIETYQREKQEFHYNMIGAVLCVLHIYLPVKKKTDYFCSEFVSEQLRKMDSFQLKKSARMYYPNNLAKTLCQQKNLYRVLVNEV